MALWSMRMAPRANWKGCFDSPYYIAPTDKVGQDAFAVIREAMRGKDHGRARPRRRRQARACHRA
jgi:hypothetical protein